MPKDLPTIRSDWTREDADRIYHQSFNDLLYQAQTVHRAHFDPNHVQLSRLLSVKTGGCPEDCSYCSQSARNGSALSASKLMQVQMVVAEARKAKAAGATRYCMGAAWREPKDRDMPAIEAMVRGVRDLGMETCMTLGMLSDDQVLRLKDAGLDYYNHNIDTSPAHYPKVITTRSFSDRIDTLARVREAGIKVCSGGILGLGESDGDRIDMLLALATLPEHPESVPINMLIPMAGTPLADAPQVDPIDFVRVIALGRILMPRSYMRLSAGRTAMTDEMQALCFLAGANSLFMGDTLLTAANPHESSDLRLMDRLGLRPEGAGMSLIPHRGLLDSLTQRGRLRTLRPVAGVDFASNDYLGLAGSATLRELTLRALDTPVGAGAARLLRGNHDAFTALEAEAAAHFGTPAALYFGCGFAANMGIFSALPQARDLVLHDALIHASALDGMRLGAADARPFAHNDPQAAREALRAWRRAGGAGQVWIAVESLYSMDGDFAPIADLARLAQDEGAFLIVDEAHASGIWGPQGRGLSAPYAARENVVTLHTCGKALGVQGALVCAQPEVIAVLVNRARSFIYSTAPSPLLAQVLRGVLTHLATDPAPRQALLARVSDVQARIRALGLKPSGSQIQPIILPGDARCLAASGALAAQGFDIRAIRAPTVPKGTERLRLSLTLNPTTDQITAAFAALSHILQGAPA